MTMTEPRIAQQSQGQTHKSRRSIYRDGEGHIDHSYVAGLAYERMVKAGKNPFGFQHKNSSDLVEQRI